MNRKLKLAYILSSIAFAICLVWQTVSTFFRGVGINYVAILGIASVLTFWVITEKEVRSRIIDVFVALCFILINETIAFFAFEFGDLTLKTYAGFVTYQHVLSVLSMFLFLYTMFRFLMDTKNIQIGFIEIMLGNVKYERKVKTSKELSNGSLEEKPNQKTEQELDVEPDLDIDENFFEDDFEITPKTSEEKEEE